jgi:hypothetical protein
VGRRSGLVDRRQRVASAGQDDHVPGREGSVDARPVTDIDQSGASRDATKAFERLHH